MSTDTSQSVSRSIDASTTTIFDLLSNPDRHADFDGSGLIRSADKPQRIQAVGDVFRMNMEGQHMGGEYQTDNLVTGFVPKELIAWKPAPAGTEPPGWEWMYELKAESADQTQVTLTYDWSKVTDKELLKKVSFPLVSAEQMEDSLNALAGAVSG
ncbi:MAG: SRPBCC family protein [Propionibacteriaceae bacterium]